MSTRTAVLEADLATVPAVGIIPRTVVALPGSSLDPSVVIGGTVYDALTVYDATTPYFATYSHDELRVYVSGTLVLRAYDPEVA